MTMPLDLYLVRHGESEGNVATGLSMQGDHSVFTEDFCRRHSSTLRLTDKGRQQAAAAGEWLKNRDNNENPMFDRYLVSSYARAMETAARLDLPGARWLIDPYLRERDMGDFDIMSEEDKQNLHPRAFEAYSLDPFYWRPPNGESMAELCLRVDRVLDTLHRECQDKRVIIVCHGMVMWAFVIRLERLTPEEFLNSKRYGLPASRIHNCQIVHYTRRDPVLTRATARVNWVRSVCPWDESLGSRRFRSIERPEPFSNEDLLRKVEQCQRIVS